MNVTISGKKIWICSMLWPIFPSCCSSAYVILFEKYDKTDCTLFLEECKNTKLGMDNSGRMNVILSGKIF